MYKTITFILMGIAGLIGWNGILASLHFFAQAYGDKVYNDFTTPCMIGGFLG